MNVREVLIMGAYKYITKTFQEEYKNRSEEYRRRLMMWRREPAIVRLERPTNIARARFLGYKPIQGIFVVRVRVKKGLRKRPDPRAGRKARHNYRYVQPGLSHQVIAEQRAARKHPNAEVINSYWVGEDGSFKYFEVIMADRGAPQLPDYIKEIVKRKGRAFRGLTSAGRKVRGLRAKGRRKQRKGSKKKEKKNQFKKK